MKGEQTLMKAYRKNGIASIADIENTPGWPSLERLEKGPCAVIECIEEIPCNPCETGCPHGAVFIGDDITKLPRIDTDACDGCGTCVPICPGLAIFMIEIQGEVAHISIPYELSYEPRIGERVKGAGRSGEPICEALVVQVRNPKAFDRTRVVTLEVPRAYVHEVRHFYPL
jgi:Fe-S-cluster-containing hydrogenase component 2